MNQVLKKSELLDCQQIPSEAELLQRARNLIPMLLEKAASVEKNRMVSKETIQAFVDAGFFKILQPAAFGGWEMNPSVFYKVLMELGRGCCSSAWNMMILGIHQWEFGSMPEQACVDVWGENDATIIASSYPPFGKVEEVDGGYRISGTWKTSSGCDHGQWAFLGGLRKDADGKVIDRLSMLVSADDYEIVDDWHTFGLAGTGSKSLLVKDAFVPYHRAHSLIKYEYSERGNHYLYPFNQVFFGAVSSLIVGMAQGGVDEYIRQMTVRTNTTDGNSAALSPYVKDRLGNAVVRVRTARARLLQMMAETTEIVERRELVARTLHEIGGGHATRRLLVAHGGLLAQQHLDHVRGHPFCPLSDRGACSCPADEPPEAWAHSSLLRRGRPTSAPNRQRRSNAPEIVQQGPRQCRRGNRAQRPHRHAP